MAPTPRVTPPFEDNLLNLTPFYHPRGHLGINYVLQKLRLEKLP